MGIFDRFRSTERTLADSSGSQVDTSEQDTLRLIDEGHVLEAEGRIEEAMQRYLNAIRLAPNPARAHHIQRACHFHPAALAAPSGMDLRLHHPYRAAQLLRRSHCFINAEARHPARRGYAKLPQDFFTLILVNFHNE
jgi:hypothetical protein